MGHIRNSLLSAILIFCLAAFTAAHAGVVNPDISAIGQVLGAYTDDTLAEAALQSKKMSLSLGETELNLDAALNPYFKGAFVVSIDDNGGADVEEAYASMVRGLPLNLALKVGKYRLNFGKLNQAHPHAYPFIRTPRVLSPGVAQLLPGEESFSDIALEASTLISVIGSWAMILSADFLEGKAFHPEERATAHGWLAHLSNTFGIGQAAFDVGASATQGVNNIEFTTKTFVIGLDAKAKIVPSCVYSLTIGAEFLDKASKLADTNGQQSRDDRYGFYIYANNSFFTRYNAGLLYEQYQNPVKSEVIDRVIKPFMGFAVLEESTVLRASYEYFFAGKSKGANTIEVQLLFSMGPHKAHQF
jgi:hypothetical protein